MLEMQAREMEHAAQNTMEAIITPSEFQQICDQAVLAVDLQDGDANRLPNELAAAVLTEVHKAVCR